MYNLNEIKESLTNNQIFDLLEYLDAAPILKETCIIARTICHGGSSHKLYYFFNTKLFRCFTNCPDSDAFDIFQLIIKVKKQEGIDFSLPQAISYVISYFNLSFEFESEDNKNELEDWKILNNYEKINNIENKKQIVELKIYDDDILNHLPHPRIIPWEREGILPQEINRRGVAYDPINEGIVIPHYDVNNNLIGIRERTLVKEEESYGKYRPMKLNGIMYNHPLSFALYNLNWSKENIARMGKAMVFEGKR
jgi:hypothetical protein